MRIASGRARSLPRQLSLCAVVAVLLIPTLGAQDQGGEMPPTVSEPPRRPSPARPPRPAARRRPPTTPDSIYTGVAGAIAGTIEDQRGDRIPGVAVRLTDERGNGQTTAATASATFEFTGLRPGSYTLELFEPGFARTQLQMDVEAAERAARTVVLPIEPHEETLHITPSGPRVAPPARTELERFLANRRVPPGASPSRPCVAGKPCVVPPRKIVDRSPSYPAAASAAGAEGFVSLEARITRDGMVEDIHPLVVDDNELGAAAIDAVRAWQFEPARLDGVALDTSMTITVEFSLK
jgi:TonB family protein